MACPPCVGKLRPTRASRTCHAHLLSLSLSFSIERSRERQETKENDGMPRKNICSSRTNIIYRLSNMKKRSIGILKVHSFCFPQRGKGSLNSKRRISESLFILKMFRRRLRQLFSLRESVVSSFKSRKILGFNRREIVRTFVKRKRNSLIFKFCNEKANQSIYIYEIYKKSLHRDFNLTCKICTGCTHVKCSSVRHASLQHGFWEEMRV